MFVFQSKRVSSPWFMVVAFVDGHELLSTTSVARNCIHRQWGTLWDKASIDKGAGEANETSWVASWVGDTLALGQGDTLFRREFWKAVSPIVVHTKGGRGINKNRAVVIWRDPRCSHDGGIIRKAQNNCIGFIDVLCSLSLIFAQFLRNGQDFQVLALFKAFSNLKTGRSGLTIDKHLLFGEKLSRGLAHALHVGRGESHCRGGSKEDQTKASHGDIL
mmetsp:Transcript_12562/g.20930  ORF Transcript_12562/g.20930 Transcript_12562/m.20930 type:complete len:218 (-) Transcript_12562:51-704(-)